MIKSNFIPLLFVLCSTIAHASVFRVGSTRPYISPNALYQANILQAGDTIEIDGETYSGTSCLAVWNKDNLVILGVNGRPRMLAEGAYISGKGIWVLSGNDITVENIEFSGATVPDMNGAGIRLDGTGLTVRHCYFHHNEDGILTSNQGVGDVLIEYTEFDSNGYGDGYSHNLYIGHVHSLTFRFNYSHHAVVGHNLKSRAYENYIYYNRIMDEETGNSSRLIDLPNGGFCIMMGNLLMQGNNAENNNLVGYGLEGLSNPSPHEFYFINNTLVNKRVASCLFVDIGGQPDVANISNNIFAGKGTLTSGTVTAMDNNLVEMNPADVRFADEGNYDYNLLPDSPAIDYGIALDPVSGHSLIPDFVYVQPLSSAIRTQVNAIDAGAYEYEGSSASRDLTAREITVYPNPTSGKMYFEQQSPDIYRVDIYDAGGNPVMTTCANPDLSGLPAGLYYLRITLQCGKQLVEKVFRTDAH